MSHLEERQPDTLRELEKARRAVGDHRDVAAALGISVRTIYRYESGESKAPKWYPLALCELERRKRGRR